MRRNIRIAEDLEDYLAHFKSPAMVILTIRPMRPKPLIPTLVGMLDMRRKFCRADLVSCGQCWSRTKAIKLLLWSRAGLDAYRRWMGMWKVFCGLFAKESDLWHDCL